MGHDGNRAAVDITKARNHTVGRTLLLMKWIVGGRMETHFSESPVVDEFGNALTRIQDACRLALSEALFRTHLLDLRPARFELGE